MIETIDLTDLQGTDVAVEADRIAAGDPTETCAIAGMQYHAYGADDGLGGTVSPSRGDRLQLVREPTNPADPNAVGIWWRNEHRLGHLPRFVAADVASALDEGQSLRAYLWREGNGWSWSAQMLLVGRPVELITKADKAWEAARSPAPTWGDDEDPPI